VTAKNIRIQGDVDLFPPNLGDNPGSGDGAAPGDRIRLLDARKGVEAQASRPNQTATTPAVAHTMRIGRAAPSVSASALQVKGLGTEWQVVSLPSLCRGRICGGEGDYYE
jgi:hypothetical protein